MVRCETYELFADYHTHTHHSHGVDSVEENVRAAAEKGLSAVAISDHGPASLFGVGVASLDTFDTIRKEVDAVREAYPDLDVLLGVEANIVSITGELDVPPSWQDRFDIVLVGLHPLVRWEPVIEGARLIGLNAGGRWSGRWTEEARRLNTRAVVNAVRRNRVHIVTHPGYRLSIDTRELARACAETGCAMEISASHDHTSIEYIQIAQSEGAKFALGSDAHSKERVGDLAKAAALAHRAGLTSEAIVNARQFPV